MCWIIRILAVITFLISFTDQLIAQPDYLKWQPENGVAVRQGNYVEWFRSAVQRTEGDLSGEVAIVWSDTRRGSRDIYMQVITTDGELKWDQGGVFVAGSEYRDEEPVVYPSVEDGAWYVAWEHVEPYGFWDPPSGDIYCTKIDAGGNIVEGWEGEDNWGVAVCTVDNIQSDVHIMEDDDEGCILIWQDSRNVPFEDIYAMHVLSDGSLDEDWTEGGVSVAVAESRQNRFTTCRDGEGGIIIAWMDGRNIDNNLDIWAQRITPGGELLWGEEAGIIICGEDSGQENPQICIDGDGGAFISWEENRNGGREGSGIYAQHIDADGELLWSEEGEEICDEDNDQNRLKMIYSGDGSAIIAWNDRREEGGLTLDIYTMKISGGEDDFIREWEPASGDTVVIDRDSNQLRVSLSSDGEGGAYLIWEDERNGGFPEVDIWAQHLNTDGDTLWRKNGVPIIDDQGTQHFPSIYPLEESLVAIWADYSTGSLDLYGQQIDTEGEVINGSRSLLTPIGVDGNASNHQLISRGENQITMVWREDRGGRQGSVPYIQYFENQGDSVSLSFDRYGIPVIDSTAGGGVLPHAVHVDNDETVIVWEDHRIGQTYSIYAQRMNGNGETLWGDIGLRVADNIDDMEQAKPFVCRDGEDGVYVAWTMETADDWTNIVLQHLDGEGNRLWSDDGTFLKDEEVNQRIEHLISDGEGGAVIVWLTNTRATEDDVWIQHFSGDRACRRNWGEDGIEVCSEQFDQRNTEIANHSEGFVVVWEDARDDIEGWNQFDIYGQFITADGEQIWHEGGAKIVSEEEHQRNPTVEVNKEGLIWVAWEDHRNTGNGNSSVDIYYQLIDPVPSDGASVNVFLEEDGSELCTENWDQLAPELIHDANGGMWVFWEDYRGGLWSDIYGIHLKPDGSRYEEWEEGGGIFSGATHNQVKPEGALLSEDGEEGVALAWMDYRSTGMEELVNLYVQRVDDDVEWADGVNSDEVPVPLSFDISAVYPNPFNSLLTVDFLLPGVQDVELKVFDIHGRNIVVRNEMGVAGRNAMELDFAATPSGIYLLQLESKDITLNRKIVCLK